jgi:hypothetical protein
MTSTHHTPGPWIAQHRIIAPADAITSDTYPSREIARMASHGTDADARLIAAAPDLLAALQEVERHMVARGYSPLGRLSEVREAIRKATEVEA